MAPIVSSKRSRGAVVWTVRWKENRRMHEQTFGSDEQAARGFARATKARLQASEASGR